MTKFAQCQSNFIDNMFQNGAFFRTAHNANLISETCFRMTHNFIQNGIYKWVVCEFLSDDDLKQTNTPTNKRRPTKGSSQPLTPGWER